MPQITAILADIDAANSADPAREDGVPAARLYGARMSAALARLAPGASLPLQIAARGQHIERWALPRAQYPEGKAGYYAWRNAQKKRHAARLAEICAVHGLDGAAIARVSAIVAKENLKGDAEAQALEDCACLVFLEFYAADFAAKHAPEKTIDILRKTWGKMSEAGRAAALDLNLPAGVRALVEKALG
jgi:hypothetical protein